MIIFTFLSIISALLVVSSTSTVYSVLWLVCTFLIVSALLGLLNLGFAALLYVIVYVGAIAILFLFVIQLLDLSSLSEQPVQYKENTLSNSSITSVTWSLAIILSFVLLTILISTALITGIGFYSGETLDPNISNIQTLLYDNSHKAIGTKIEADNYKLVSPLSIVTSIEGGTPQVLAIAKCLYGPHLLSLIIVSVLLLVAMIAPIALCL